MRKEILDIHTHNQTTKDNAIINLPMSVLENPGDFSPLADKMYSAGIFPLYEGIWEDAFQQLENIIQHPQIIAIGECGLDKRSPIPIEKQKYFLGKQIQLAERVQKTLIIHCVHCWNELLEINKRNKTSQKHIIHGFRGKPQLAEQLLRNGFLLSFGPFFNIDSLRLCPKESRFMETDNHKDLSIQDILNLQKPFFTE
jgi:TatD DNase family protein